MTNRKTLEYQLKYLENLKMVSKKCREDLRDFYKTQLKKLEGKYDKLQ